MTESIPRLDDQLPELLAFTRTAARQIEAGELRDGGELARRIDEFYTAERMADIERVAPGWRVMSQYAAGATLAARALPMVGFATTEAYAAVLEPWSRSGRIPVD